MLGDVFFQNQFFLIDAFQQLPAQAVNRLALLVHHIVVFEQVFTGFEVLTFDRLLRCLDAPRDQARFDGDAFFHAQTLQQVRNPLFGEDAHQVIFEREIEARGTGIALTAGAATQLIVDAAGFVAFGAENVQTAGSDHFIVLFIGFLLVAVEDFIPLVGGHHVFFAGVVPDGGLAIVLSAFDFALRSAERLSKPLLQRLLLGHEFGIAAEQNVGSAASHVGGDCHHAFAAGLSDDLCFPLVIFGIEHDVLDAFFLQQFGKALGLFDRSSADQHRLACGMEILNLVSCGVVFFLSPSGRPRPDFLCAAIPYWSESP